MTITVQYNSVNTINAQIKIQEIWKALNIEGYPLTLEQHMVSDKKTITRDCRKVDRKWKMYSITKNMH